jgi:hypothetical protein
MTHPQTPQALAAAMMSKIDDIKDNISDGDYLELCNLLKKLNDTVKDYKPTPAITSDEADESDDEPEQQADLDLDDMIEGFMCSTEVRTENGDFVFSRDEMLEKFNAFIVQLEDTETSENPRQWFYCPCGCRVCTNGIREHIEAHPHNNDFNLEY